MFKPSYVFIFALSVLFFSAISNADNMQLGVTWTDPTPSDPEYNPTYEGKYKIDGVEIETLTGLSTPAFSKVITVDPAGSTVEVSVRAVNGTIEGPWSAWVSTGVNPPGITPYEQTTIIISVTPETVTTSTR